jgi:hypothetical protein
MGDAVDDQEDLNTQAQATNTTLQALIMRITEIVAASRALLARLQGRSTDEQPPPDAKS